MHGHSFLSVKMRLLPTVDRSLLFFRDCLLCRERLLTIGKPQNARRRKLSGSSANKPDAGAPRASNSGVCQCLSCGRFAHRECVSFSHAHRYCRGHESLMPVCSHAPPSADALLFPPPLEGPQSSDKGAPKAHKIRRKNSASSAENLTLATLIEELNSSSVAGIGATSTAVVKTGGAQKQQLQTASKIAKKLAPVLAAGGVVGPSPWGLRLECWRD